MSMWLGQPEPVEGWTGFKRRINYSVTFQYFHSQINKQSKQIGKKD